MFEPASIRSLLRKRNISKITTENQQSTEKSGQVDKMSKTFSNFSSFSKKENGIKNLHNDPDLQSIIEAKMMIKEIDHQVKNIRQWREHQKQLLDQKLKNNLECFNLTKAQYEKSLSQLSNTQNQYYYKLMEKMKNQQIRLQSLTQNQSSYLNPDENSSFLENYSTVMNNQQQDISQQDKQQGYEDKNNVNNQENEQFKKYDHDLMGYITSGEERINRLKHQKNGESQLFEDKHLAFLSSFNELATNNLFPKQQKLQKEDEEKETNFDRSRLKQELQDIDKELKQMEELLKD